MEVMDKDSFSRFWNALRECSKFRVDKFCVGSRSWRRCSRRRAVKGWLGPPGVLILGSLQVWSLAYGTNR